MAKVDKRSSTAVINAFHREAEALQNGEPLPQEEELRTFGNYVTQYNLQELRINALYAEASGGKLVQSPMEKGECNGVEKKCPYYEDLFDEISSDLDIGPYRKYVEWRRGRGGKTAPEMGYVTQVKMVASAVLRKIKERVFQENTPSTEEVRMITPEKLQGYLVDISFATDYLVDRNQFLSDIHISIVYQTEVENRFMIVENGQKRKLNKDELRSIIIKNDEHLEGLFDALPYFVERYGRKEKENGEQNDEYDPEFLEEIITVLLYQAFYLIPKMLQEQEGEKLSSIYVYYVKKIGNLYKSFLSDFPMYEEILGENAMELLLFALQGTMIRIVPEENDFPVYLYEVLRIKKYDDGWSIEKQKGNDIWDNLQFWLQYASAKDSKRHQQVEELLGFALIQDPFEAISHYSEIGSFPSLQEKMREKDFLQQTTDQNIIWFIKEDGDKFFLSPDVSSMKWDIARNPSLIKRNFPARTELLILSINGVDLSEEHYNALIADTPSLAYDVRILNPKWHKITFERDAKDHPEVVWKYFDLVISQYPPDRAVAFLQEGAKKSPHEGFQYFLQISEKFPDQALAFLKAFAMEKDSFPEHFAYLLFPKAQNYVGFLCSEDADSLFEMALYGINAGDFFTQYWEPHAEEIINNPFLYRNIAKVFPEKIHEYELKYWKKKINDDPENAFTHSAILSERFTSEAFEILKGIAYDPKSFPKHFEILLDTSKKSYRDFLSDYDEPKIFSTALNAIDYKIFTEKYFYPYQDAILQDSFLYRRIFERYPNLESESFVYMEQKMKSDPENAFLYSGILAKVFEREKVEPLLQELAQNPITFPVHFQQVLTETYNDRESYVPHPVDETAIFQTGLRAVGRDAFLKDYFYTHEEAIVNNGFIYQNVFSVYPDIRDIAFKRMTERMRGNPQDALSHKNSARYAQIFSNRAFPLLLELAKNPVTFDSHFNGVLPTNNNTYAYYLERKQDGDTIFQTALTTIGEEVFFKKYFLPHTSEIIANTFLYRNILALYPVRFIKELGLQLRSIPPTVALKASGLLMKHFPDQFNKTLLLELAKNKDLFKVHLSAVTWYGNSYRFNKSLPEAEADEIFQTALRAVGREVFFKEYFNMELLNDPFIFRNLQKVFPEEKIEEKLFETASNPEIAFSVSYILAKNFPEKAYEYLIKAAKDIRSFPAHFAVILHQRNYVSCLPPEKADEIFQTALQTFGTPTFPFSILLQPDMQSLRISLIQKYRGDIFKDDFLYRNIVAVFPEEKEEIHKAFLLEIGQNPRFAFEYFNLISKRFPKERIVEILIKTARNPKTFYDHIDHLIETSENPYNTILSEEDANHIFLMALSVVSEDTFFEDYFTTSDSTFSGHNDGIAENNFICQHLKKTYPSFEQRISEYRIQRIQHDSSSFFWRYASQISGFPSPSESNQIADIAKNDAGFVKRFLDMDSVGILGNRTAYFVPPIDFSTFTMTEGVRVTIQKVLENANEETVKEIFALQDIAYSEQEQKFWKPELRKRFNHPIGQEVFMAVMKKFPNIVLDTLEAQKTSKNSHEIPVALAQKSISSLSLLEQTTLYPKYALVFPLIKEAILTELKGNLDKALQSAEDKIKTGNLTKAEFTQIVASITQPMFLPQNSENSGAVKEIQEMCREFIPRAKRIAEQLPS
jgi:hypothetical protein